jgi:hypothetical protein
MIWDYDDFKKQNIKLGKNCTLLDIFIQKRLTKIM